MTLQENNNVAGFNEFDANLGDYAFVDALSNDFMRIDNAHTADLQVDEKAFVLTATNPGYTGLSLLLSLGAIGLLAVLLYLMYAPQGRDAYRTYLSNLR